MKKLTPQSTVKEIRSAENKNEWLRIACVFGWLICSIVTCYFWTKHMLDTTPDENIGLKGLYCVLIPVFAYGMLMRIIYAICHINIPTNNFFEFYNGSVISMDLLRYYRSKCCALGYNFVPSAVLKSKFSFYDIYEKAVIFDDGIYLICPICGKPIVSRNEDCKEHLELLLAEKEKQKDTKKKEKIEYLKSNIAKIVESENALPL